MKNRSLQVLTLFIIMILSFSLAACNLTSIFEEDDDREEENQEETEYETEEEAKDKTSDVTESEEPSTPSAPETVETSEEDLAESVEDMLPVFDAIAYVMTFESETGLYDSEDTNFTAKVIYMGTQLHGSGIFNDAEDIEGTRTVSYADIEELANACFDTLTVDITLSDEHGRFTYSELENVFYAGIGDGMYESEIDNISLSDDGTLSVVLSVIEPDSGTPWAQYTFTLVENDFFPASGSTRYPFAVISVESIP